MATCRGIDVSSYQATQDWAAQKKDGVVFAFAKASEGQTSRDAKFATHITGIKAAGLVPGAYHFAWPTQDAAREAANYIDAVKPHAGRGFTHWLDLERYSDGRNYKGRTAAQIKAWVAAWAAAVQAAFPGQRVGVYTSADDIAAGRVPAGLPLWYPAYPGTAVDTYVEAAARAQPAPSGRDALIWQFTSDPAGSGPRVDLNIAYMSEAAFRAWAAGTDNQQENEMQLSDQINLGDWIPKYWPTDKGLADKKMPVDVALGSGYAHSRKAAENTVQILAQLGAQQAIIDKLVDAIGTGGGLTAAEVKAAAEAGAQAALDRLATALKED